MRDHPNDRHHGTDILIICLVFALAGLEIVRGYDPVTVTTTVAAITFAVAELIRSIRRDHADSKGDLKDD